MTPEEIEACKRNILFVPCRDKKALHSWIKIFLGLDLPDSRVDPDSNCTPMEMAWECYDKMLKNDDPSFKRVLYYAARESGKTLVEAVIETLCLVHLERDVVHLAAIEAQSRKAQEYVRGFMSRPYLRDYLIGDNQREILVIRYHNQETGENLTQKQFADLDEASKMGFNEIKTYARIIVATLQSTNGQHAPVLCVHGDTMIRTSSGDVPAAALFESAAANQTIEKSSAGQVEIVETPACASLMSASTTLAKWVSVPVVRAQKSYQPTVDIALDSGANLVCTREHPVFVWGKGFAQAKDLLPGDCVATAVNCDVNAGERIATNRTDSVHMVHTEAGLMVQVAAQEPNYQDAFLSMKEAGVLFSSAIRAISDGGMAWVYDFTLAENHNYISNGILSHNCLDELDIIKDRAAYEEAQLIPSTGRGGKKPLTILTSTRKFSFGLVQNEIDKAADTGLHIRRWNVLDVTEACTADRHKPDEPRVTLYRSSDLLKHIKPRAYEALSDDQKNKYVKDEGAFAGCEPCRLYPMCRGRLATEQKSKVADDSFVKDIDSAIAQFRNVSNSMAKAQLLCWKPSTDGLIYPQYDRDVHMKTAAEIAEMITGEKYSPHLTKQQLIDVMKSVDLQWQAGMDFGFTHNFSVVTGATDGYRAFIVDVIAQPELDDEQKVAICNQRVKLLNPSIWADPAYPGTIATFKKKGYRMRPWQKTPGSVVAGIEVVRGVLRPTIGEPRVVLLKDDPGCELLGKRLSQYHWKLDTDGRIGNTPVDELDDECFTGETEVLTSTGWVRLDMVTYLHEVLAVEKDGKSFFERPLNIISKPYEGKLDIIDIPNLAFRATPNHKHAVLSLYSLEAKQEYLLRKKKRHFLGDNSYWARGPLICPDEALQYLDDVFESPVVKVINYEIGQEDFNGMVYCVQTSTGFFQARTNGKPFVAGNCDAVRYWLMNAFGPKNSGGMKVAREGQSLQPGQQDRLEAARTLFRDILQENGVEDMAEEGAGKGTMGSIKWNI